MAISYFWCWLSVPSNSGDVVLDDRGELRSTVDVAHPAGELTVPD